MKNPGYKVDFSTKTLTITKAFEKELYDANSEAAETLARFQAMFPDLKIARRTHRPSKKTNPDKGLNYARMERYIRLYENAEELLAIFETVKEIASTQKNSFRYTKKWFVKQFPNFEELPKIVNGKIYAIPIAAPEVEDEDKKQTSEETEEPKAGVLEYLPTGT